MFASARRMCVLRSTYRSRVTLNRRSGWLWTTSQPRTVLLNNNKNNQQGTKAGGQLVVPFHSSVLAAAVVGGAPVAALRTVGAVMSEVKDFLDKTEKRTEEKTIFEARQALAQSFGELTSEGVKKMDDQLKIFLAGSVRRINAKLKDNPDMTYDGLMSLMMQNPFVEPMEEGHVDKNEKYIEDHGFSAFNFDHKPDPAVVKEVEQWFKQVISDPDVLADTKIDVDFMAKIVARTGGTVDAFREFFRDKEYHEETMVDLGILRYPDTSHPFFKVYRIKLVAWRDCSRILFFQDDKNGITCDYNCRRFKPREEVIAQLTEETKRMAVEEAEAMFA